ncbi:MAG TPA: patatin-like phospholipase family protein [Cytophagaceae bacterium]|jgi:NTE family protein
MKLLNFRLYIISTLLLLAITYSKAQRPGSAIENLIFEGGGIRGLAYPSALAELEKNHFLDSVKRVAGTSAGAIVATLYAVGYSPNEMVEIIENLRVKSFADGGFMFFGGTYRVINNFGWYKSDKLNSWISYLIQAKTGKGNITFSELAALSKEKTIFKELYLTGTDLNNQKAVIFGQDTYPNMEVRLAVRISVSIPFFFQAPIIDQKGKLCVTKEEKEKGTVFTDGGIIANFPLKIFDNEKYINKHGDSSSVFNDRSLGFRLDDDLQVEYDKKQKGLAPQKINDIKDYIEAFYIIVIENLNRQSLTKEDWERTVSIKTSGIGPRIRRLSKTEVDTLLANGREGALEYVKRNLNSFKNDR